MLSRVPSSKTLSTKSRGNALKAASAFASMPLSRAKRATTSQLWSGLPSGLRPVTSRMRVNNSPEGSLPIRGPRCITARCTSTDKPRKLSSAAVST